MVSDVEPMVSPSRDVGGEFVGKISVTGLLPKLDAGAPYNGWIFGGRLLSVFYRLPTEGYTKGGMFR
jgi:hypothetical protein